MSDQEFVMCPEPGCESVAEIVDVFDLPSTDGPVRHRVTRCVQMHVRTTYKARGRD